MNELLLVLYSKDIAPKDRDLIIEEATLNNLKRSLIFSEKLLLTEWTRVF